MKNARPAELFRAPPKPGPAPASIPQPAKNIAGLERLPAATAAT